MTDKLEVEAIARRCLDVEAIRLVKNLGETSAAVLEFLTGRRCCDNGLFGQEHECQKQDGGRYV